MTAPQREIIEAGLQVVGYSNCPCLICGGCTEKHAIQAMVARQRVNWYICNECLKADDIDARLDRHAAGHDGVASMLRDLTGRLKLPRYDEWRAANDAHEAETKAYYEAGNRT